MTACPRCGAEVVGSRGVCESCGAPLVAPPRKGWTSARFLVVIVVAAAIVLAAVFLLWIQSTPNNVSPAGSPTTVSLETPVVTIDAATIAVHSVSKAVSPTNYRVGLMWNGSLMGSHAMPTMENDIVAFIPEGTMSGMTFAIRWTDGGTKGVVDAGDSFIVNRSTSMMGCFSMNMQFRFMWSDGTLVASAPFAWTCPSKPVVTFTGATVTSGYATFTVAGVSTSVPITYFRFNLGFNGSLGPTALALSAGSHTITAGGHTFYVNYTDISGNGNLKAGDAIRVALAPSGGLPHGSYNFYLIWSDGSLLIVLNWTV